MTFGLSICAAEVFDLQALMKGVASEARPRPRIFLRDSSFLDTSASCVVLYDYCFSCNKKLCLGKYRCDFERLSTRHTDRLHRETLLGCVGNRYSVAVSAWLYSLSLLRSVRTLMERSSAARVLFWLQWSSVLSMSRFSISATVIPAVSTRGSEFV